MIPIWVPKQNSVLGCIFKNMRITMQVTPTQVAQLSSWYSFALKQLKLLGRFTQGASTICMEQHHVHASTGWPGKAANVDSIPRFHGALLLAQPDKCTGKVWYRSLGGAWCTSASSSSLLCANGELIGPVPERTVKSAWARSPQLAPPPLLSASCLVHCPCHHHSQCRRPLPTLDPHLSAKGRTNAQSQGR